MNNFAGTLPLIGTDAAARWDNLYVFLVYLSIFFFVLVVGGMFVFIAKYRASKGVKSKYLPGSHALEAVLVAIPTVLLMIIFAWGYSVYRSMTESPSDAYEIRVIGKQWLWQFQYDNGKTTIGDLYVPMNRPVKLIMTSEDVLHSFFVPNFRIKQDVVPGMYTSVWFEARVPGKHQIYCAEYCGTSHSGMLGKVIALDDKQWTDWNAGRKLPAIPIAGSELTSEEIAQAQIESAAPTAGNLVQQGKTLFETKGCVACHSVDGSAKIGPTLKGVFGKPVELADGSKPVADENYIRESIENPAAKIVKGFNPTMPTFKGILTEAELNALMAYIKSLKE